MQNIHEARTPQEEIIALEARIENLKALIERKPGTQFMHEQFVKDLAECEKEYQKLTGSEELEKAA